MKTIFEFNEQQLQALLKTFRREPAAAWSVDKMMSVIQVIAIVAGAIWTLHEYHSFTEEHNALILSDQRFKLSQQENDRAQKTLNIQMAELTLAAQKKAIQLSGLQLQHLSEERLNFGQNDLNVKLIKRFDDGTCLYKAHFAVDVENKSESEFEISYSIAQYFIGSFDDTAWTNSRIVQIDPPPDIFNHTQQGEVTWKIEGYDAHRYGSTTNDISSIFKTTACDSISEGGGLVGDLRQGEHNSFEYEYLIRAHSNDVLAFVVNCGVNGAVSGRNVWPVKNWQLLSETVEDTSTKTE